MREFLDLINQGEKVHPKHGQYHSEGWDHKLIKTNVRQGAEHR